MRPLHAYLLAYVGLVLAAVVVLWRAGVLARLPGLWTAVGVLIALGLAAAAAASGPRPNPPGDGE